MAFYRKKPVIIEARKVREPTIDLTAAWCGGEVINQILPNRPPIILIKTLEGEMTAQIEDFIIRGVHGEFYPCKPEIFHETYEHITDQPIGKPI